jgi:hypothetical protein
MDCNQNKHVSFRLVLDGPKGDDWMSQVAAIENNESTSTQKQVDLVELEEMTFCSQLLARYQTLLGGTNTGMSLVEPEVLPEWTWKYASLKRFLARPQWECSQPSSSCIHCHGTIHSGAKCRGGCTMPLFKSVRMSGFYTITTSKWNCGAFYIA